MIRDLTDPLVDPEFGKNLFNPYREWSPRSPKGGPGLLGPWQETARYVPAGAKAPAIRRFDMFGGFAAVAAFVHCVVTLL